MAVAKRIPDVIVSMTTYPPRMGSVLQALEPLCRQTVRPDRIVLCLAHEDFPEETEELREVVAAVERVGAEVLWSERSLGPHDKYFWTMKAFPDDIVITVDDDLICPLDLVQRLLETHHRHPGAVVAWRTHLVGTRPDPDDASATVLAPYREWMLEQKLHLDEERHDLLATGGAGALYPPHLFDEGLLDEEAIRSLAPRADDLWMFVNELRSGIPVVNTTSTHELCYVPDSQGCALCVENLDRGGNDVALRALFARFPLVGRFLIEQARGNEASSSAFVESVAHPAGYLRERLRTIEALRRSWGRLRAGRARCAIMASSVRRFLSISLSRVRIRAASAARERSVEPGSAVMRGQPRREGAYEGHHPSGR